MWSIKQKPRRLRRQPLGGVITKPSKVALNYDAQDDVYIVNATDFGSELLAARYTSDGKIIAIGGATGSVQAVQPNTHEVLGVYHHSKEDFLDDPITCLREYPISTQESVCMLATSANGHIQCWDVCGGDLKFSLKEPRQSLGLAVSSENFITTGDDGVLYLYDLATTNLITRLEASPDGLLADGHSTRSFAAMFNPTNPKEAISGGWDDCVHFWDVRQKHSLRRIGPAHICGSDALDFTPDGKQILTAAYQKTDQLRMWEYATGNLIRTLDTDRFPTSLYAAVYLSDSVICAGGSDPSLFRAVEINQKATIGLVKDMVGGVSSIHKTGVKLKFPARPKLNKGRERPSGKSGIPRVVFCAGQYLFEVEFY